MDVGGEVKKEKDEVAAERGDISALLRFNYKREMIPCLKELDSWGLKLKYLPIVDMCVKQNNMEDAEYFLQKAESQKEKGALYKYALFLEKVGNNEKAIEKLMEITKTPDDENYVAAYLRLFRKHNVEIDVPQDILDAEKEVKENPFDLGNHPFSEYPLRHIVWYSVIAIFGFLTMFKPLIFIIPFGILLFLSFVHRFEKLVPEWDDLREKYDVYANELGEEFKEDPDLGIPYMADLDNAPKQEDYQKLQLFSEFDLLPMYVDDKYSFMKAQDQHYMERDQITLKIHYIRMNHLIQRYYKGEKYLMPILVHMYHLKYDGEKFIGNALGQNDFYISSVTLLNGYMIKTADEKIHGMCFYPENIGDVQKVTAE